MNWIQQEQVWEGTLGNMGTVTAMSHLSLLRICSRRGTATGVRQPVRSQMQPDLIKSGIVRAVPARDAGSLLGGEGFRLLDVRPVWETEKARVRGSVQVPLFVEDTDLGPVTLLKKWVHFGYIGAWTGSNLTTINEGFLQQVEDVVPDKEDKLLVACGEGLRSMIAVKVLYKAGYRNLAWLVGGFNRSVEADFPGVEGTTKLQYATIGGASYLFLQVLLFLRVVGNDN